MFWIASDFPDNSILHVNQQAATDMAAAADCPDGLYAIADKRLLKY